MLAFIPSVSNNEKLTNLGHCNLQGAEAKHLYVSDLDSWTSGQIFSLTGYL